VGGRTKTNVNGGQRKAYVGHMHDPDTPARSAVRAVRTSRSAAAPALVLWQHSRSAT